MVAFLGHTGIRAVEPVIYGLVCESLACGTITAVAVATFTWHFFFFFMKALLPCQVQRLKLFFPTALYVLATLADSCSLQHNWWLAHQSKILHTGAALVIFIQEYYDNTPVSHFVGMWKLATPPKAA